ncbi:hypothetical protein AURDEDRAFT_111960 [Auricularia subglabra TFB-10046 SS5]|nr:hypothetical protein AURDEDRAFT_111960 [Auricularia subglabra TFB-10046 SS5]
MAQFLREQALTPPAFIVRIKGTHSETTIYDGYTRRIEIGNHIQSLAQRSVSVTSEGVTTAVAAGSSSAHREDDSSSDSDSETNAGTRGRQRRRRRGPRHARRRETRTVVDFDFSIDIAKFLSTDPELFVIADSISAYRGLTCQEVDTQHGRRAAKPDEQATAAGLQSGDKERLRRGEAPWQLRFGPGSRTLEQWAEEYVRCDAAVKDFKFTKVIHGWDLNALESAIRSSIASTLYSGKVTVEFSQPSGNAVHVRPCTTMSKMRSNAFLRGLLNVTLVWPVTYMYEQQFRTCGAAYALKRSVPLADALPQDDITSYLDRTGRAVDPRRLACTAEGISECHGLREGEWFAMWEETIKSAVVNKVKNSHPLVDPVGAPNSMASKLDGYPGSSQAGPSSSVIYQS